jgi:hypothetical protein
VATDDGSVVLPAGEGKTVSFSGNRVRSIHGQPGGAYSVVEWASQAGVTGTPLHVHEQTDEAFYVLDYARTKARTAGATSTWTP